jgi:hypothetical protein
MRQATAAALGRASVSRQLHLHSRSLCSRRATHLLVLAPFCSRQASRRHRFSSWNGLEVSVEMKDCGRALIKDKETQRGAGMGNLLFMLTTKAERGQIVHQAPGGVNLLYHPPSQPATNPTSHQPSRQPHQSESVTWLSGQWSMPECLSEAAICY